MKASRKPEFDDEGPALPPSGQIHECGTCGKRRIWGKDWLWYGSYKDLDEGEPIFKACSIDCMENRELAEANRRKRQALERLKADEEEQTRKLEWLRKKRELAEREQP